jgi:hypothetical protein
MSHHLELGRFVCEPNVSRLLLAAGDHGAQKLPSRIFHFTFVGIAGRSW